MTPKKRERGAPARGGETCAVTDLGEPVYHTPVGPAKSVVKPVPADAVALSDAGEPTDTFALVPSVAEVAALPRGARAALALRCAARAAHPDAITPDAVAARLVAAATTRTPLRRQLLCVRRDFDRLARLAKEQNWTDETPVPVDVFGPLWPADLAPAWAKDSA